MLGELHFRCNCSDFNHIYMKRKLSFIHNLHIYTILCYVRVTYCSVVHDMCNSVSA